MPRSAAQVEAALLALRVKKGLTKPAADPIYRVAVEAGIEAYVAALPTHGRDRRARAKRRAQP